ncbi:50S ribosomal protein L25/general stress protein Ctc [Halarcobacter anaerophilus]|uniref:Large ribosomal subunit protein bL25 n=1 Tax=Halarcobacter anaerophilus TaxID=877500 RepID=A0A4Q0XWV8_9BACT|nr:50S ribosomal protein L25/general stress protein Ctc [Halarcobacter anaerophilus]QDF28355.1 50S ribosomal protein L25 [Halarcobacter anaerophilus]RXJ61982.1 50S ribosomal protein L25/general stress protein Ctc [Halarcobacter anaerophilus]
MLEGIVRDSMTKQGTKSLRRDGYLIANIYGKGLENINAAFKKNEFIKYLKNKTTLAFDVKVGDNTLKVVVQEYQKDPISSDLLHVDLMVAQPGVRTTYKVPVKVEGTPVGLKNKGLFIFHKKRVPVKSTIENLPESFTLQIADLDVGHSVLIRDLDLPEGVDCYLDPRVPLVGVIKAK